MLSSTTPVSRGIDIVRTTIQDYLKEIVPITIMKARSDWNLNEWELPMPEAYYKIELDVLDRYPAIGINVVSSSDFAVVDIDNNAEEKYITNYSVRLFTWVRTPLDGVGAILSAPDKEIPYPEKWMTIRLRDDMASVIRQALLVSYTMGNPALKWERNSLLEEYSELTGVKGDRWVAAVVHSFDVRLDESVSRSIIGGADTLIVEVLKIPKGE